MTPFKAVNEDTQNIPTEIEEPSSPSNSLVIDETLPKLSVLENLSESLNPDGESVPISDQVN